MTGIERESVAIRLRGLHHWNQIGWVGYEPPEQHVAAMRSSTSRHIMHQYFRLMVQWLRNLWSEDPVCHLEEPEMLTDTLSLVTLGSQRSLDVHDDGTILDTRRLQIEIVLVSERHHRTSV